MEVIFPPFSENSFDYAWLLSYLGILYYWEIRWVTVHTTNPLPVVMVLCHSSRWLTDPQIDTKTRKWAIEGLAYLTNDADVKDDFVEDEPAMKAMFELAKVGNQPTDRKS